MSQALRLLAVLPHPDDESLGMGGTLARYAAEGVATYLLCATRGEQGWPGPQEQNPGPEGLGRLREAELRCAAEHLRLHEVCFLDYFDGSVDEVDPGQALAAIAAQVRRIRPHVVVTFSPDGAYGHPDHIALAQLTAGALVCAADPAFGDAQGRPHHRVSKFYYLVDSVSLVQKIQAAIGGISIVVDGSQRNQFGWEEWAITTRIDARAYFDTVWQAILCHRTQLPGYGPFVDLPRTTLASIFGEGTFVRVFSLVNGGRAVEDDLFAGLR